MERQRPPPTTRDRAPVKMDSDITDLGGRPDAVGSGSATECRQASMRLPVAPVVPEKKTPPTTTTVGGSSVFIKLKEGNLQ